MSRSTDSRSWVFRALTALLALSAVAVATIGAGIVTGTLTPGNADETTDGSTPGSDEDALVGPNHYASALAVCALIDPEDLEIAFGYPYHEGFEPPVTYPVFASIPGVTRCTYLEQDRREVANLGVVYAYAEQVFQDAVERSDGLGEVTDVADLGDRAVWTDTPPQLLVLIDDKMIALTVPQQLRDGEKVELARRLADKVIGRLR